MTGVNVDLKVAQLMCSRVCHDLMSPVNAINAGLELLTEGVAGPDEATGLMGMSAGQATRKLSFFRVAFGLGGGRAGALGFEEIRHLTADYLDGTNCRLEWPDGVDGMRSLEGDAGKLFLIALLIASETLPRGGVVRVAMADFPEGLGVAIDAHGQDSRIQDDIMAALNPVVDPDALTARNVHGHLARKLAESIGADLELSRPAEGETRLALLLPEGAGR